MGQIGQVIECLEAKNRYNLVILSKEGEIQAPTQIFQCFEDFCENSKTAKWERGAFPNRGYAIYFEEKLLKS